MLIKDCERRLNMLCTVSITQKSKWYDMLLRIPGTTQTRLYVKPDGVVLQMFFLKSTLPRKFAPTLLANRNAIEKKDVISITEPVKNQSHVALIEDILHIPSVMSSQSFLMGNELNISFRFHSSALREVNRVLSSRPMLESHSRTVYLGPSPGAVCVLNEINKTTPLTVIRFSLLSPQVPFDEDVLRDFHRTLIETEVRMPFEKETRLLLYPDKKLKWATMLSEEDLIFELSHPDDPFLIEIEKKCYKAMIPLLVLFGRITRRALEVTTLLPSVEAVEFLKLFYEIAVGFKQEKPVLELYQPLTPDMWDWL